MDSLYQPITMFDIILSISDIYSHVSVVMNHCYSLAVSLAFSVHNKSNLPPLKGVNYND